MNKKHKKKKNSKFQKRCENCGNCLYICEGDYLCDEMGEVVISDYNEPTSDYMACDGKEWVRQ